MLLALSLLLYALVSIAFLTYLGYGLVKLLLPEEWRPVEGLLAPLAGYALVLLVGYYAVHTVLNLVGALIVAAVLATILNAYALWRRRGEGLQLGMREHGGAWAIGLLAFLLAVLPLISYGYPTVIGENWDPENYLYVTDALVKVPLIRFYELPPNPLRELNASLPSIGLTPGFSIFQGTLQLFRGWNALNSFAPTVALLYGLAALAFYLLFRQGFKLSRWAGLLAAALAGLFPLALWVGFFNFGMQMSAMPLVPLALVLWLGVLRNPSWKTMLLAALPVAALPIAYYPALTVFVPAALGLGLVELVRAPKAQRRPLFLFGLGTSLLALLLAALTIFDYLDGFDFRYSQQMTTLGLFTFPPLRQILGVAPFSRIQQALPGLWSAAALVAVLLIVLFSLLALWRSRERWLWLGALLPGLLYLAWLRGGFWYAASWLQKQGFSLLSAGLLERVRPYPYAYLKGAAFVAPLVLALAVAGWEEGQALLGRFSWRRIGQGVLLALVMLPLLLSLLSDRQLVARYWGRPALFGQEILQVQQGVDLLPEGASVYLTGHPELSRPAKGLLSYMLRGHPVQGRISTGYGAMDYRRADEPSYALLAVADDPQPLGFSPENILWSGGEMVLYQRDPSIVSFLDLRADAYSGHASGEIHTTEPLAERQLASFGSCPQVQLSPGRQITLYMETDRITRSQPVAIAPPAKPTEGLPSVQLALVSMEPTTVTLVWESGAAETAALPGGFALYAGRPDELSTQLTVLASSGSTPVWICWAALRQDDSKTGAVQQADQVAVQPQASVDGATLQVDLPVLNDSGRPLRLALEVWENTFQGAHHYAWWGPLALPRHRPVSLRADLSTREAEASIQGKAVGFSPHPGADGWPDLSDGDYFASLWVYYGSQVVDVIPVGRFQLRGGQVQDLQPLESGIRLLWPHSPAQSSGAHFGPDIELSAYDRGAGPFSPGDQVSLALEWHALDSVPTDYAVTAQILRDGKIWGQWDGLVGQWLPASTWQAEQYVRDDIPLFLDAAAPRGRYRLIVALYDPATGIRLPVTSDKGKDLGDAVDLGEIVVK